MSIILKLMPTYIALLRGINMAGHKPVKMDKLCACFESLKFKSVRTYIQSGNVIFKTNKSRESDISKLICRELKTSLGYDIEVMLRTPEELVEIVNMELFEKVKKNSMPYVTFVTEIPKPSPIVPIRSPKKDLEIIHFHNRNFFSVGHLVNGRRGFPNTFIEKEFKIPATTRNWNTVRNLVELIS